MSSYLRDTTLVLLTKMNCPELDPQAIANQVETLTGPHKVDWYDS